MKPMEVYESISQRAVSSYRKALTGADVEDDSARASLRAFFRALYDRVFQTPSAFGLPAGEDLFIADVEADEKAKKQEVLKRIKKPREMIVHGLDFLMLAGIRGTLDGQQLILADFQNLVKESGIGRKFLAGLEEIGLAITTVSGSAALGSREFPSMMAALKPLAEACARVSPEGVGKFHFARCDFNVLQPGFAPDAPGLYASFDAENFQSLAQLHQFLAARGFKFNLETNGPFAWVMKYQGNRKIKGTPLFQVEYDERHVHPLRMVIKCVSTNRIADLMPGQPQFLQDDFIRRVYACRGDECGWCRNQKTLGPSLLRYQGEEKKVCWYSNGTIHGCDEPAVELVKQYVGLHEQLLPVP